MKKRFFLAFLVLFVAFCYRLGFPFWNTLKSYGIMPIYDLYMVKNSLLHQKGIGFFIPGGMKTKQKDWYPYMLHHHAGDAFSHYMGRQVSLDILYSFGHFDFWKGSSSFYNMDSPYYGAFYGGYAVFPQDQNWIYGFDEDGNIDMEEIKKVPMFDQTYLVLPSIGLPTGKGIFRTKIKNIRYGQSYMREKDWVRIDAEIETNAPTHQAARTNYPGYVQYGKPHNSYYQGQDYPIISLKGRIYVKYFEEYQGTFFLYVMARDEKILDECDQNFLSHAFIGMAGT
ncbi:hypothetical protein [Thermotalea metallivorans]|uniref:Uncharacterized protein n=1 Tax=Thermotalea metallivorans TaxID=520762 RepID=A0A140LDM0_9FIRM|nr:hypothetical protein [Thermotalea metallivorans]KXG78645.1 hypothetical protein AN619_01710 [Thermotalea metallivorans]